MDEILAIVERKHGRRGKEIVVEAHRFMKRAHKGQKRADESPFYEHLEAVARILVKQGHTDPELLAAAILHDVIEDTEATLAEVTKRFGEEIAFLVDAATDPGKGDDERPIHDRYVRMRKSQEKIMKAGAKDPRIFLIKSADRAHNLQTMSVLNKERRDRLSKEAREFHMKIAKKAGSEELASLIDELVEEYLDSQK